MVNTAKRFLNLSIKRCCVYSYWHVNGVVVSGEWVESSKLHPTQAHLVFGRVKEATDISTGLEHKQKVRTRRGKRQQERVTQL